MSPVLGKFCNQIPLAFKVKFPGSSQSLCQIPRLGNLWWALELLQQWENFLGITVLQFVGHLLGGSVGGLMATFSKRTYATHRASQVCFIDYTKAFDCVDHNKLWKILKEMEIPDHLTCPLRNLYAGQEATVRTGHGTMEWFQFGKGVHQGCILSSCLFNLYAEYIMQNPGLDEAQVGIGLLGKISITSDMQMTPSL